MTTSSTRTLVADLVDQFDPTVRAAFLEAIDDLRSKADVEAVARALAAGDLRSAMAALNLDPAAYDVLDRAVAEAFRTAGVETLAGLPIRAVDGARVVVRFDGRNAGAESWLRNFSATMVTRIHTEQQELIRVHMSAGLREGQNPKTIALDIVGRMNPDTGRRQGGVIGLTVPQQAFALNARAELLSGDPRQLRNYLTRARRDKRFDSVVFSAIEDQRFRDRGSHLPAATVKRMVDRYRDRLLLLRGEMLGRTEAMTAVNGGHYAASVQLANSGTIERSAVQRTWRSAGDSRVRHSHKMMDGQVRPVDEMFQSPSGARLQFPGDPNAPAAEIIGCFHPSTLVHVAGLKGVIARHYSGELVELVVAGHINLAVTPNHPVLTQRGWIAAGDAVESDYLVNCEIGDTSPVSEPQVQNGYATAEGLRRLAELSGRVYRAREGRVNLHGEVPDHDVEVVAFPGELRRAFQATGAQALGDIGLKQSDILKGDLLFQRLCEQVGFATDGVRHGIVGLEGERLAFLAGHSGKSDAIGLRASPSCQPQVSKAAFHLPSGGIEFRSHGNDRSTLIVEGLHSGVHGQPSTQADGPAIDALELGDLRRGSARQGQIVEAAGDAMLADPKAPCDARGRLAVGVQSRDCDVKAKALFRPVRLLGIRRGHYDGPVFNFEADSGLIVAQRLVTHNCRCYPEMKINFLKGTR